MRFASDPLNPDPLVLLEHRNNIGIDKIEGIDAVREERTNPRCGVLYRQHLDTVEVSATRFPIVWIASDPRANSRSEFLQDVPTSAHPLIKIRGAVRNNNE